ncbi:GPN-loop GTPase 3 [Tieghemostelium lacteum]|uniref:GPN-loop GTPase 3 n=1 Tax=Tieghemostelium lacteum TaxID=361077 RepID=A0A151ZEJ9_TIELA|nr:GPN-loop GTPase 3 [Tieghemostelium lacteum]|eukprot:KYQ92383.1 GPN-loop GTPase 3 [Tieghemostelium lacteum]
MGKHCQLVMGPAGSGKSTYCDVMRKYCEEVKRVVHVINLDPAAEVFQYPVSIDIKNLVTVDEVMDELKYGPNGGLVYAMEYLVENMDWLVDELGDYEDDYLIIDCPGQIELYSHIPVMKNLVTQLEQLGYRVCSVFLLDSQFILDNCKFISGALMCLSAMIRLEVPHVNVLTKIDVLKKTGSFKDIEKFLDLEVQTLVDDLNQETDNRFHRLNSAIGSLLEDYNLVGFLPLDITDQESLNILLQHIDNSIQYGEDLEPQENKDDHLNDEDHDEDTHDHDHDY